jgi:hypothetical protein
MRSLIYVPIIHTEADLGSLAGSFKKEYTRQYSAQEYQNHVQSIEEMWDLLTQNILALEVNWGAVRLYQDGLPICGRETLIVTDLAAKGSLNHRLLVALIQKGAWLEGTEDKNLLLEEYQHFQKIFSAPKPAEKKRLLEVYKQRSEKLLQQRDQFIADRIDATLRENETGLLFIGMIHKVDQYLPPGIQVNSLIRRLPFDKMAKI